MSAQKTKITRRDFLKGITATAISAGAVGLLGACSDSTATSAAPETTASETENITETTTAAPTEVSEELTVTKEEIYDLVVVGAGGAGMAAALQAAEDGVQNIVLIEKSGMTGGTSGFATGMFATETPAQLERGYVCGKDYWFKYLTNYHHHVGNDLLARRFLEMSSSTPDWLNQFGANVCLPNYNQQRMHWDEEVVYNIYGTGTAQDGSAAIAAITQACVDRGIDLVTGTEAAELVKEADGTVSGVICRNADGEGILYHGKAVILATGGAITNADILAENRAVGRAFPAGNDGKGLEMAWNAGAQKGNIVLEYHGTSLYSSTGAPASREAVGNLEDFANYPLLWVDTQGRRFMDEGLVYDTGLLANSLRSVGGLAYVLIDQATVESYETEDFLYPHGFDRDYENGIGRTYGKVEGFAEQVQSGIDNAFIFTGATIEELAANMGVKPEILSDTVSRYNSYVENGYDADFNKEERWLKIGVKEGPFYAIAVQVSILVTIGGLEVTERLEVVDDSYQTIPGLYTAGNNVTGIIGDSYPDMEGLTLGFAYNSGRIAGKSAAQYILNSI